MATRRLKGPFGLWVTAFVLSLLVFPAVAWYGYGVISDGGKGADIGFYIFGFLIFMAHPVTWIVYLGLISFQPAFPGTRKDRFKRLAALPIIGLNLFTTAAICFSLGLEYDEDEADSSPFEDAMRDETPSASGGVVRSIALALSFFGLLDIVAYLGLCFTECWRPYKELTEEDVEALERAENAKIMSYDQQNNGFPQYYDPKTGAYYDPQSGIYYYDDSHSGSYYYYDPQTRGYYYCGYPQQQRDMAQDSAVQESEDGADLATGHDRAVQDLEDSANEVSQEEIQPGSVGQPHEETTDEDQQGKFAQNLNLQEQEHIQNEQPQVAVQHDSTRSRGQLTNI